MSAAPDPTQFFVLGGTLRRDAPSYIMRQADEELLKQTLAGAYCNVLAARQMGKSSLMVRTADRLRAKGARTAIIDLTAIGTDVTTDEWYFGLIARLARQLQLQTDEQTWWKARPETSPVQRFSDFVHEVVLQEVAEPSVVFIDEIDSTLRLKFTDDFFAAIRAMFNARADEPAYQRISFVLLGVARPADLIKDRTRTPYNVGVNVDLTDFTFDEAQGVFGPVLEAAHPGQGADTLQRVLDWTGGQPYLTQKLCADVAARSTSPLAPVDIDQAVERLFLTDEARKESNLQAIRDRVLSNAHKTPILKLYQKILDGKAIVAEERSIEQNELKLTGLVRATPQGLLTTRNRVYAHVFDKPWVKSNLPVDRSRRVAVAAIGVALLAIVVTLVVIANQRDVSAQPLIDQFSNTTSSEVRISSLAGLIRLGENSQAQALSDSLGLQGWIDLLSPANLPKPSDVGSDLLLVGDRLYQTVPNTPDGNTLLKAAAAALDQAEQPEAVRLSNEINNWLQGRELAVNGKVDAALDWFNRAYATSEQRQHANAGVLLDRAGVYAELNQPDRALTDFEVALQLDARLSSAIVEAITRRPELLAFWASNQKGYQQLINILPTLTATPTSTSTPIPTLTPFSTPTPITPTPLPTPVVQPQFTSPTPGFQPQNLTPIPTVTSRPVTQLRPIVVSSPTDLLAVAPRAAWTNGSGQNGLWLDQYPAADSVLAPRGYAAYVPADRTLETGTVVGQRLVLATHPEFKPDGYIQGIFPLTLPSQGAQVASTLEFIKDARFGAGVDGVQIEMWWFDSAGGSSPGKLLGQVGASDNGNATNLPGDLSLNGGQTGELRIIVRARANSGNDWLTWTQLTVFPN